MANREVNLTKYVRCSGTKRYCPVILTSNGKVKPDVVLVDGKEERHPEGSYYLDWTEDGKRFRRSVGKNAADALARRLAQESRLNARSHGIAVPAADSAQKRDVATAAAGYLAEIRLSKKPKTYAAYSKALEYFQESCPKKNLEDIDRTDLVNFSAFLRDTKEQAPRSCWNKFNHVMVFLNAVNVRAMPRKDDWPKFTEEEPEIYEPEELDALFAVCDADEKLWFEFFLMTGMREQEVMYTYWSDINLRNATIRVTAKPDRGWTPKAYRARTIPIHAKLVSALSVRKPKTNVCPIVFPTNGCRPRPDFLKHLKAAAERAELNEESFWLHKFRSTFATRALRAGNDLRTVQRWLGHKDIKSTMRYLRADESEAVRERVAAMF